MKILSYNVNGLRAACKSNLLRVLQNENADVVCLQEIRLQENQLNEAIGFKQFCEEMGYKICANYGYRPGYAGTAILTKGEPEQELYAFDRNVSPRYDICEGRVVIVRYKGLKIINSYVMNSKNDASRQDERELFNQQIVNETALEENTILCGDLNAISQDIDIYKPNLKIAGNYTFERQMLYDIRNIGYFDAFRELHKDEVKFTWFPNYRGFEEENKGLRLDYFMVSNNLRDKVKNCDMIQSYTSDHKPIYLDIEV